MKFIYTLLFFAALICWNAASAQNSFWAEKKGPYGGSVGEIEHDPAKSLIYALVEQRFFYSTDDGVTWTKGNVPTTNSIYDVEVGDNGSVYLTDLSAIYKSTNGKDFTKVTTNFVLSSAVKIRRISNGGGTILGLASNRLYFSTDDGVTFTQGASGSFSTSFFVVGPGISGGQGVYFLDNATSMPRRSVNGGVGVEVPTNTGLTGPCYNLASRNEKSQIFVVNGTGIFSATNGDSWTAIKGGSIADATIANGSNFGLLEFSSDNTGMYFIDNLNEKMHYKALTGTAWQQSVAFPGATGLNIFSAMARTLNASSPATSVAMFGNGLGIRKTTTGTSSFEPEVNTGIAMADAKSIMSVASGSGNLLIDTENLGLMFSSDRGQTWSRVTTIPNGVRMMTGVSNSTEKNTAVLAINNSLNDTYRTTSGSSFSLITTPVDFRWIQGTTFDRAFALSTLAAPQFYFTYNSGTNWTASPVTISGLPATYTIDEARVNVYSTSSTQAVMFAEVYNTVAGSVGTEYYRITFTIGATTTISGAAVKLTTIPSAYSSALPDVINARNGRFFLFTDDSNPDQYSFSTNAGAGWTTLNAPYTGNGRMFVADNGYVFFVSPSQNKIWVTRDDGATFTETALPPGTDLSLVNIADIHIDTEDFAQMIVDRSNLHSSTNPIALPANPTSGGVTGRTATSIAIAWNDNANNEDNYRIERSSNGGTTYTYAGDVPSNTICTLPTPRGFFVDHGLTPSTTYLYKITAVNSAGTSISSASASITTFAATTPNIPDGRSWNATTVGGGGYAAVTTPKVVGIRHMGGGKYEVSDISIGTFYGAVSNNYKETFYETNGQTTLAVSNSNLEVRNNGMGTWNGTTTLTVRWKRCGGTETETVTYVLNGTPASDPAPLAPTGVQALVNGTNSIEVSWAGAFYEKDFIVERSPNGTTGFVQIGSNVVAPTTKLIDPGPFTEATAYYYRVRARNQNNVASPNSVVASALYRKPTFLLSTAGGISTFSTVTLGMYAGDFNNDGKDDLFSVQANIFSSATSQPVIFANQGNGNFNVVLPSMASEGYMHAMVGDINNDGKLDVGMGISGKSQFDIYFGNGDFTFTKATIDQLGDIASVDFTVSSCSLVDFNKDGRLDILLMESGDEDFLYEQTVSGSFVKVTGGDLALDTNSHSGGLWADYDNDGDQDLLFVHSSSKWRLYRNNGDETFTNVTVAAGLDQCEGMGGPWGDYNNDGHLDLFAGDSGENALYKNNGNGTFTKEGPTGVSEPKDTYGNIWGDFNNDGTVDLVTPTLPLFSGATRLFINNTTAAASFQLIQSEKINDGLLAHYGGAAFDFDGNGFLDVGLANFSMVGGGAPAPQTLYVNNNSTGNWLQTKLVGVTSNKSAIGARVIVVAGGKTYIREIAAVNSFFSQSSFTQHFGLGSATTITSIQVKWPSGVIQNLPGPTINQTITITEDGGGPAPTVYLPANNATGVNTRTSLEVTFDETPTPVNGKKITITAAGDASPTYSIDMSAAVVSGMKLTFTLPGRLLGNTHYDVAIEPGAVVDGFANPSLAVTSGWGFTTATGPAISALLPLNTATAVAANAPLEITWSAPITAVADKKIKAMTGPTTLLEVAVATSGTVAGAKYSINAPTGGWPYLSPITVTLDAGAFVDGSSNDTEAISGSAWTFTTVESPDITPPEFGDVSGLPTTTDKAALVQTFNITVTDAKGVANAKVWFRKSSGGDYTQNAATPPATGNTWQFQIPASGFDATGTQYYFTATDNFGNEARSPATGTRQVLIKYKGNEAQIPTSQLGTGGTKEGWKVIAIPFDLGVSNSVLTVFDELEPLEKKVAWRLLALRPEPKAWLDYPEELSTLSRGVGYFINIVAPPTIIVGDNLVAPNNTRDNLFKMDLKKGWNMVGNPYLESIDWANVVAANGLTGTAAVFKKYSNGAYSNASTLVAYEGGFVQSDVDRQVSIPFLGQTTTTGRIGEIEFGPEEWLLPIIIKQGEISNTFGGVGMHSKATSSFDLFDDFNGPRFIDFTEMNFKHPEHFVQNFARDVVPVADEYVWEFTVDSNVPDIGTLRWDNEIHPAAKDLYLYDVATQTPVNMKETSSYSFDPKTSHSFKIYYGENALSKISPARVMLGAAYPNPTSNITTVPFSIPEKGGRLSVRLEVFDATGRKVATLANGEFTGGFYKSEWQPHDGLTNGLYFYRLLAGGEVLTGKVVLKK